MTQADLQLYGVYYDAYMEGWDADLGDKNPYSEGLLGRRCAWAGGYWDSHDRKAAEVARKDRIQYGL